MSSRAAGGRKQQLKPLKELQNPTQGKDRGSSKSGKGFFSRSKSKHTESSPPAVPDPAAAAQAASAYPSPPPAVAFPLRGPAPGTDRSYPPQQQGIPPERLLSTNTPPPSSFPTTNLSQRQHGPISRTPIVQSNSSSSAVSYASSGSGEPYFSPSSRSHSLSPLPLTSPSPSLHSVYLSHAQGIEEDPRYPNFSRPQAQARQQLRPLPVPSLSPAGSNTFLANFDFPYPPTSSPPQDSLLLQPIRRAANSPLFSEFSGRYPQTPLTDLDGRDRPNRQAMGRPLQSLAHLDPRQAYEPSISDTASSVYPSPPSSNPRLTPPPPRWSDSPSVASDGEHGIGYRSFSSVSASSSAPSIIQEIPRRPPAAESIISTSSGSSGKSGGSDPQTKSPPTSFHFPGSRSTGRPKVSPKTGTPQKMKIRTRKKHSEDEDSGYPQTLATPTTDSFVSPAISPLNARVELRASSAPSTTTSFSPRPRANSATTHETTSTSSTPAPSPSSNGSGKTFVYPSSRSRAQPSRAPLIGSKKKDGVSGPVPENERKSKFKGIGIRLKRKKRNSAGSLDEVQSTRSSSPRLMYRMSDQSGFSDASGNTQREGIQEGQSHQELYVSTPPYSPSPSPSPSPAPARFFENERRRKGKGKGKFGSYPLDPYDSLLLDNDRLTGELLRRLNPTNSPTFHNYGNSPPSTILDLGCGQGYWVLDAAITWKGYGTHVTGYDMVDTTKALRPWAVSQGVADNISFVRGNFLRQRLPFPDESFDLVRMSCLTLCITSDTWEDILQEVSRILALGGRLELIDDYIFFPYGKSPQTTQTSNESLPSFHTMARQNPAPVTSDRASIYSMATTDTDVANPGLGLALSEEASTAGDLYDLYGLQEEDEADEDERTGEDEGDTATLNGTETSSFRATPRPQGIFQRDQHDVSVGEWNHQQAISKDLEALFEHMMTQKYGLHLHPSSFILDMLKKIFGHAREMTTMHLTLAPPVSENSTSRSIPSASTPPTPSSFSQSPGLLLWPSTLIAMSASEIELHTSKHLRTLLSCKNNLVEHALEATEDEEIDEESVLEAIWEYENFLRPRFYPPPGAGLDFSESQTPTPLEADIRRALHQSSPSTSRMSVFSANSVSTENQDAMWEYQLDARQRFGWSEKSDNPSNSSQGSSSRSGSTPPDGNGTRSSTPSQPSKRDTIISSASSAAPPYSLTEPTHVRTFRVYEAIKVDQFTLEATAM